MNINIREDQMQHAELFGKPVLYTNGHIPRDSVPDGWYCYDMRGLDKAPGEPATLEDQVGVNYAGTVLSPVPLKKAETKVRRINGKFILHGEPLNLKTFCEKHGMEYPKETKKFILRPASSDEAGLFFSTLNEAEDRQRACVGHIRLDFGSGGREFWHTWWDHNGGELITSEFKAEFQQVVDELRERGPLKNLAAMSEYCDAHPAGKLEDGNGFGVITESEQYRYCLRCCPRQGDYNGYLYVYDKHQQELNITPDELEPDPDIKMRRM